MSRQAQVVILGAGILGCALAWRLAARKLYPADAILVLDPNPLASQATSRSAALLSAARPAARADWIALVQKTLALIGELASLGRAVPLHCCGALHLAASAAAKATLLDFEDTANRLDVSCERVRPKDWAGRLPWLDMSRFSEALWFPEEAYTDPYLLASAYGGAAKALGVRFALGQPVALAAQGSRVVIESGGQVHDPASLWVAAGAWSNAVLRPLGARAAQAAVRSHYWITEQTSLATAYMPMVLATDLRLYARPERGAILFGLRESEGVAAASTQLPDDLAGFTFDPADACGYATLEAFAGVLEAYAPRLTNTGLAHYISGPSCYTPDGEFLIGSIDGWDNLKLLAGCNGAGIAASGGLAELAVACESAAPSAQAALHAYRPQRFGAIDPDDPQFLARCIAVRAGKTSA